MQRVKVYGADLIRFFEEWPPGPDWVLWRGGPLAIVDGTLRWTKDFKREDYPSAPQVEPAEEYIITYGSLVWVNEKRPPPKGMFADRCLVDALYSWMHAKTFTTFAVEVPRSQIGEFRTACSEHMWNIRERLFMVE